MSLPVQGARVSESLYSSVQDTGIAILCAGLGGKVDTGRLQGRQARQRVSGALGLSHNGLTCTADLVGTEQETEPAYCL